MLGFYYKTTDYSHPFFSRTRRIIIMHYVRLVSSFHKSARRALLTSEVILDHVQAK